jgi:putative methionine-R-sulfoxide reductase with GAF domain
MRWMRGKGNQTPTKADEDVPENTRQEIPGWLRTQELALEIAVRAASQYTGASAAAIALLNDEMLVCRARVGGIAPDLGMRLNLNSGITGACVRSAAVMHCEDTESDPRVDSAVCRTLGIRSILVVPVLAKENVVGVVEVLSAKDHAFGSEHIEWLAKLADFVCEMSFSPAHDTRATSLQPSEPVAPEQPGDLTESKLDRPRSLSDERNAAASDTSLADFLSVLPKNSHSSTWDELSEALTSRMKIRDKP